MNLRPPGYELGVTFFDTAMAYQNGTSEQYVGRALRDFAKRDDYVIATKFTPRTQEELDTDVSGQEHVARCLDASLQRLGMDHVDLYIYHMWDYHTPMEEIMDGLGAAVKAGKVRAIGASNCFAWQLAEANAYARANGLPEFVSYQGHYNLIAREDERETLPYLAHANMAATPYSALASGRLSRLPGTTSTKRLEEDAYAKFKYDATAEADGKVIERVAEVVDTLEATMTQVALAWLLTKVASPVVGATKLSHVEGAAKATDLKLAPEQIAYLEEPYVPHALAGVMAQNGKQAAGNVV